MRFIFILFLITCSLSAQINALDVVENKVVKTVEQYLGVQKFTYQAANAIPELGVEENHIFKVIHDEENVGYFVLEQGMGQYDYFDYLVVFNSDLTIKKVKILHYREDYGYEISSRWWLSQFLGKKAGKEMRYKDDIDALSGATISAKSLTDSLKILSQNMFYWKTMDII